MKRLLSIGCVLLAAMLSLNSGCAGKDSSLGPNRAGKPALEQITTETLETSSPPPFIISGSSRNPLILDGVITEVRNDGVQLTWFTAAQDPSLMVELWTVSGPIEKGVGGRFRKIDARLSDGSYLDTEAVEPGGYAYMVFVAAPDGRRSPYPWMAMAKLSGRGQSMWSDGPIKFTNHRLEYAIRKQLDKMSGGFTADELAGIKELYLDPGDTRVLEYLNSLEDLQYCTNLSKLWIRDAPVKDFSRIAELRSLKTLRIIGVAMTPANLQSVANRSITELELTNNGLADLAEVENLQSLERFSTTGNKFKDLSPIIRLSSLKSLTVEESGVADFLPLTAMSSLRYLTIKKNPVQDFKVLGQIPNLDEIVLVRNGRPIGDISWVRTLRLIALTIVGNELQDITPLSGMSTLQGVIFSHNKIVDATPIKGLPLSTAYFNGNPLSQESKDLIDALSRPTGSRFIQWRAYTYE